MFCLSDILQNVSTYHVAYFKYKKCDAVMFCLSDNLQNVSTYDVAYIKSKKLWRLNVLPIWYSTKYFNLPRRLF
jgi:hypothetical protein